MSRNGAMTVSIMTLRMMTLSIRTLSMLTLSKRAYLHSIKTLY
jgi:hypothetical protein